MSLNLTDLLELAGVVLILVAAFAADWRLGIAVLGVLLIVASVLVSARGDDL